MSSRHLSHHPRDLRSTDTLTLAGMTRLADLAMDLFRFNGLRFMDLDLAKHRHLVFEDGDQLVFFKVNIHYWIIPFPPARGLPPLNIPPGILRQELAITNQPAQCRDNDPALVRNQSGINRDCDPLHRDDPG